MEGCSVIDTMCNTVNITQLQATTYVQLLLTMFPSRYCRKASLSASTASATTSGGKDLCDDDDDGSDDATT